MNVDDAALRDLLRERAARARPQELEELLVAALRRPVSRAWSPRSRERQAALGLGTVGVAVVVALLAVLGPLGAHQPAVGPGASGSPSPSPSSSPTPTDVPVTMPPHVAGTCPTSAITDFAGGVAPEVITGSLHWRWGGVPWLASVAEKLVIEAPATSAPSSLQVIGEPLTYRGVALGPKLGSLSGRWVAAGVGTSWSLDVGLPAPGCWLLTAITDHALGSVVVDAGVTPSPAPAGYGIGVPARTDALTSYAASACPTSPTEPGASVRTYLDGTTRWVDPAPSSWRAAQERKLVLYGAPQPGADSRAIFFRIGMTPAPALVADPTVLSVPSDGVPPAFDAGVPAAGCWVAAYIDPAWTSTIVAFVAP